jgi:gliding motility-associated-like protein
MKRSLLLITLFFIVAKESSANHITGGEMFYTYTGQVAGGYQYHVTLKLFRDHFSSGAQLDPSAVIAVFDRRTGAQVTVNTVPKANEIQLILTSPSPCITNPPVVHYDIAYYEYDLVLPASANGYLIAYQRCCRIDGISNLGGATGVGATYTAEIPANTPLLTAPENNSARFTGADTVIVCEGNPFSYSFAADDADPNDELVYSFCTAYTGGTAGNPAPNPPSAPPYAAVPYGFPFSASSPMGNTVTLDPATGLITGTAPTAGIYIVTVCVQEIREGNVIAVQRKDLQVKVGNCNPLNAQLNPQPTTCDGFVVSFDNDATNPANTNYHWTFGDPASGSLDTAFTPTATHDYTLAGAGTYNVRLRVSLAGGLCIDSTDLVINVFPGFFPNMAVTGGCYLNPFQFRDETTTNYGFVDTWRWDFGDETTLADTSHLQHPQWTFSTPGTKTATLKVSNSKGCSSTITYTFDVLDKPAITMDFRDTLICIPDAVTLGANGTGTFSWTPLTNITGANTQNPTVNPTTDTWYVATINDNGCFNKDSVHVRVVSGVTLAAMPDTTICLTDPVQLTANTNGLTFLWSPPETLDDPTKLKPIAMPVNPTTTYTLRSTIGSCFAEDFVTVTTVPYPVANAGPDQTLCYNASTQLNGSHDGISFTWTPTSYLSNPTILNPITSPPRTTAYVLTALDNAGCPKPGRDTVVITMLPKVKAYAGRDTIVVIGQPLQFNGSGGVSYTWSPSTGLSGTTIPDPVGVYNASIDSVRYKLIVTDAFGCADSAFVKVTVFKTKPYIFVPTAFTPNNDGKNDIIAPICAGIMKMNYFSIYNRWGQLVFTTTSDRAGWDGKINGRVQDSNVFVWQVSALDYMGNKIFLKGTVALIR